MKAIFFNNILKYIHEISGHNLYFPSFEKQTDIIICYSVYTFIIISIVMFSLLLIVWNDFIVAPINLGQHSLIYIQNTQIFPYNEMWISTLGVILYLVSSTYLIFYNSTLRSAAHIVTFNMHASYLHWVHYFTIKS